MKPATRPRVEGQQALDRWPLSWEMEVVARALAATLDAGARGDREDAAGLPEQLYRQKTALLHHHREQRSAPFLVQESDSTRALREMAAGAMRHWGRLGALVQAMQNRRGQADGSSVQPVEALLRLGVHCLEAEPDKAHRIVDQAVECAKRLAPASAAYVNAVLRRFGREREALLARVLDEPVARWNFPPWWIENQQGAYPQQWQQVLGAAQYPAPLTLRVNRRRSTREAYLERLRGAGLQPLVAEAGITAGTRIPGERLPPTGYLRADDLCARDAIFLPPSVHPALLPGYEEGWFSVQDLAAQQAGWLLEPAEGLCILDACAAPGGKTSHLLELADCEVHAWDVSAHRLRRAQANLQRLGLHAHLRRVDLLDPRSLPAKPAFFDRILLDAPCSASGLAGRHPEIRWRRRPEELSAHQKLQRDMLEVLWQRLAPGGLLLFATCSVFPQEGCEVIAAFAAQPETGREIAECRAWTLLPSRDGPAPHDGFYYARLGKRRA